MSGIRWTTGFGIALGGIGGAVAALMGTPATRNVAPPAPAPASPKSRTGEPSALASPEAASAAPAAMPGPSARTDVKPGPTPSASAAPLVSAVAPSVSAVAPSVSAAPSPSPSLELPTTRDGLLKAELFCDKKKDFDECTRAAEALEKGTAGPADLEQAKRFRRIALTHLVAQCEADSAHACFVLAAKYRAGTELAAKPASAEALEKRAVELCRLHPAPECPKP